MKKNINRMGDKKKVLLNNSYSKSNDYNPAKIESKWQKKWQSSKIFKTKEENKKSKYYVLDMFPYPSGEGLHVGHPKGYIATDIISRYKRMNGFSVLHPMGFDAFGLPAENYAIKTKTNPAESVKKNVARYKKQLEILGFDYDWSREVNTTDPKYYKWTQWIFLKLLEKGLAYESYEPINWCPSCKTGLANEDVEDGRCERCGTLVEKKPMRQWVLKITDYAERLLSDLDIVQKEKTPLFVNNKGEDAVRNNLPFVERDVVMCIVKHWKEDKFLCLKWKKLSWNGFVLGGIEKGETARNTAIREITEETGYTNIRFIRELGNVDSKFFQSVKNVNRFAHFTVVYLELIDGQHNDTKHEEKDLHDVVWIDKNEVIDFINRDNLKYAWELFIGKKKQESKLLLDWPEAIKTLQKNWIGKSEGALIKFKVQNPNDKSNSKSKEIEVFTTRPDTLFGVTYVVLAPEHKLVNDFLSIVENRSEVEEYIKKVKNISEIERTDAKKEKTGVELKGVKVINPANDEAVPLWIADYVLPDYGTGAVMAVPAHDERDWEFAKKFGLKNRQVVVPYFENKTDLIPKIDKIIQERNNIHVILFNPQNGKYLLQKWKNQGWQSFVTGGVESGENIVDSAKREVLEETGYKNIRYIQKPSDEWEVHSYFYAPHKDVNRYMKAKALYFELLDEDKDDVHSDDKDKYDIVWIEKSGVREYLSHINQKINWDFTLSSIVYLGQGKLINSGKFNGINSEEVKKEITESVGGKWVTKYKLRDWVFSRQRYWGEPIPVIHCENCKLIRPESNGIVPVPEKDLPVVLPKVKSYEPTGTGESPLAIIEKWVKVKCPVCKSWAKRETNTMPQWAGSSWYYLRYLDPKNNKALASKKTLDYWCGGKDDGVDLYVGGAEHATRHLIYARFWHKFLYDIGVVSNIEPFLKLQHVGLIMGEDGRKMSKRFLNVINPDEIVKNYGADSLRLYEMFMGPFDQQISWSTASISGVRRFIEKVWRLKEKIKSLNVKNQNHSDKIDKILHKTIKKVTEDIENMRYNTAISSMMIAVNEIEEAETISKNQYEIILKLLAPFVPHITEELWFQIGNKKSIHISAWPKFDHNLIVDDEVTIMIQVNGKLRGSLVAIYNTDNSLLENKAKELVDIKKWLEGKEIIKVIVIPNRLINFVVR